MGLGIHPFVSGGCQGLFWDGSCGLRRAEPDGGHRMGWASKSWLLSEPLPRVCRPGAAVFSLCDSAEHRVLAGCSPSAASPPRAGLAVLG